MTFKSILIHVDHTQASRARVRGAAAFAGSLNAQLIGLGARRLQTTIDPVGSVAPRYIDGAEEEMAKAEAAFRQETKRLGEGQAIWRKQWEEPTKAMLGHCVSADLVLAAGGGENAGGAEVSAADLIVGAGSPVLCMQKSANIAANTILLGWKDTRETRRALRDGLPLLARAERVHVVSFADDERSAASLHAAVERLKLHGVRADGEMKRPMESCVAEDFMQKADQTGADLIVVGGYGHSRLREWALGGVTQGLLEQKAVNVLFSH